VVDVDPQASAVGAHHPQPVGHWIEVDSGADAGLERLRHLALHRGLAGFGIDGDDRAVAGDAVKHAVGRAHGDGDAWADRLDVDLRRRLAHRRVDGHDRLAVDEADDPTCRLSTARTEARCGKRPGNREYFELSKHDVAPLKKIRVCRSGTVPGPTPGATRAGA